MATITIPKKIEKELSIASREIGISKEDFLINATLYYASSLQGKRELNKELNAWEKISNKDLLEFEKRI